MVAVTIGNIEQLKGMPDVEFDFGVSAALRSAFSTAASKLSGQQASRSAYRSNALIEFAGHYSTVFRNNGVVQLGDLDEIVEKLRDVDTKVGELETEAREENERRRQAREWAQRMADRSGIEKWWDGWWGSEQPPVPELKDNGPSKSAERPETRTRDTPEGGGGSSGGGTSSAHPEKLSAFATNTKGADDLLKSTPGTLEDHCSQFASMCKWAHLDASSVISGFRQWLTANGQDASWALAVGAAFANAGSAGDICSLPDSAIAAALSAQGATEGRSDIQIDPPTAYGSPPTTGYADDPVNIATGNFIENEVDLSFAGACAGLQFARSFSSLNPAAGAFGAGWSSWTDCGLVCGDESARLTLPDGRVVVFPRAGSGWGRARSENLWLEPSESGTGFVLRDAGSLVWEFSGSGRLLAAGNGEGSGIDFGYDDSGRLVRLTHEFGRWIDLVWDGVRVVTVEASDGRRIDYEYDQHARLLRASGPGYERSYRWNDAGLIEAVIDADGVVEAENRYDETGRVAEQVSAFGRVSRFAYLPGGVTVVSDADGERANTWITDRRGRLVGVIDADGRRQSMSYDRWGNLVMATERDGSVTVTEYDEHGRKRRQALASGARLEWCYDQAGRVIETCVTGDDGQQARSILSYDGDSRHPSMATDPVGGVTRMYWERGLLTEIVDPTGVRLRFGHDEHGDLISSTDAHGNTARLERDESGRVVAAITPLGFRTSYRYDAAGLLAARIDPDGATWAYEHTAGGKISAVVDPLGGRTETQYGSGGLRQRVSDPLGRSVTTAYDDLGNLSSVELPDGVAWEFGYDASSRLRKAVDSAGGEWQWSYGPGGQVSGTTDPTGVRRHIQHDSPLGLATRLTDGGDSVSARYDRLGRVISVTGPDGRPSLHRYDLCGRLVETVDQQGAVTSYRRDQAGRVVSVTQPMGGVFGYEYDACGRWVATTSTGGDRYELHYDPDGRVASESWPTGEQVSTAFDACGRVIERVQPGRGITRFRYDKCGRIVGAQDPWYGRRSFVYDAAGQLIEAVNALGGVTRFEYDDLGRQIAAIDPMGGRTTAEYDGMNRMVARTDPLGRTTTYSYDAAGRRTARTAPDGGQVCWSYDGSGRLSQTMAAGKVRSAIERDFAGRTMRIVEDDIVHDLAWDARGNLLHRLRNGEGMRYGYDQGGRRTSMTRPDGATTTYGYDANNRLATVQHPGLGRVALGRDGLGRVTSLEADGLRTQWSYQDGYLAGRRTNRRGFISETSIVRDADGRIVSETVDGLRSSYDYDQAGQLISTRTSEGAAGEFIWDANGRLVGESANGLAVQYRYDQAGQLLESRSPQATISFDYDDQGRRTRRSGPDGEQLFAWDPMGYLCQITDVRRQGDRRVASSRKLRVDALGELSSVDDTNVWWDSASELPVVTQIGLTDVVNAGIATALTGAGASGAKRADAEALWSLPGASGGAAPWLPEGRQDLRGLAGMQISPTGGMQIDGLDWLQARVYDPGTRGFLSTDPLRPVTAAGWAANPYSFAGNDPVNQSDPLGLSPVTDAELAAYRDSNHGTIGNGIAAAGNWVQDNWEYIAAGALVVGGLAVMATGVGGPIGAAMIAGALTGAGGSIWSQKSTNGSVDWGKVGIDAAIGGATGLIGGGAGQAAVKMTSGLTSCLGKNILSGAIEGGIDGGASGGIQYLTSGQPITMQGLTNAVGEGALSGSLLGGGSGALASVSDVARYGCFTADTDVLMADGTTKPIDQVVVGDEVTAFNPETGQAEPRKVTDTFVHDNVATVRVTTTEGEITSTITHPFYVEDKGWLTVGELQEGDRLRTPEGKLVKVLTIQATGKTETVYNIAVEGLHNYHVRTSAGTAVLVHNNGACETDMPGDDDWPVLSGILRDSSQGKGNFGLGSGTNSQAQQAGLAWVGDGYHAASDGKTLVSADGLHQWRPPSYKPILGIYQSNFEQRWVPQGQWQGNGHLDILDLP
ncbi:DUF6531 domain-containing protein [Brooklawnia sp.]|uniref:DUF6531 domain-containing protein n=1 Tax=Brooklawnia sp. TaxID=2699740 RepID=UPI00311EFA0E